jgi:hypothetical protein
MKCSECFTVLVSRQGTESVLRRGLSLAEARAMADEYDRLAAGTGSHAEIQPTLAATEMANAKSRVAYI